MRVIGLTGGVGSGKSLVAQKLGRRCHAELLIADELGYLLMLPGTKAYDEIVAHFGQRVVGKDKALDRALLAEIVFAEEKERQALNAIVHPAVTDLMERYIRERERKPGMILLESAILFEAGCDRLCDKIVYVRVAEGVRRRRLAENRGYSQEKITSIMARQMTERDFCARCDIVIDNNGSEEELEENLERVLPRIYR